MGDTLVKKIQEPVYETPKCLDFSAKYLLHFTMS